MGRQQATLDEVWYFVMCRQQGVAGIAESELSVFDGGRARRRTVARVGRGVEGMQSAEVVDSFDQIPCWEATAIIKGVHSK